MKSCYTIIIVLFLAACQSKEAAIENTPAAPANTSEIVFTEKQFQNAGIALGAAKTEDISTTIRLSGEIDVPPSGLISISIPYGGFLKQTSLIPGQQVQKGQLLAVLEHPDYVQLQQDYLDTEAKMELAQQEFDRQKQLAAEKVTGVKNVQQVRTELNLLTNSKAALVQKLRMINIDPAKLKPGNISRSVDLVSPIDGFVKSINANIGKMVNPADVLFELIDKDHLHLKLNAFEKDINLLGNGQTVDFTLPNDETLRQARILLTSKSVEADKTIQVHADIVNPDSRLLPGMFVTASVNTSSKKVTVLPQAAVVELEGKNYIFHEAERYSFRRVEVTTGIKDGDLIEVVLPDALKASDKIVIRGAHNLLAREMNMAEEE